MLVAIQHGVRVEAVAAAKSNFFTCPKCKDQLILKQGDIVIHHFGHYPGSVC
jgi:competence CoiA-like predicted nuclease